MLSTEVHLIRSTVVPSAKRCPPLHLLVIDVEKFNEVGVDMILLFIRVVLDEHGIAGEHVSEVRNSFSFA